MNDGLVPEKRAIMLRRHRRRRRRHSSDCLASTHPARRRHRLLRYSRPLFLSLSYQRAQSCYQLSQSLLRLLLPPPSVMEQEELCTTTMMQALRGECEAENAPLLLQRNFARTEFAVLSAKGPFANEQLSACMFRLCHNFAGMFVCLPQGDALTKLTDKHPDKIAEHNWPFFYPTVQGAP